MVPPMVFVMGPVAALGALLGGAGAVAVVTVEVIVAVEAASVTTAPLEIIAVVEGAIALVRALLIREVTLLWSTFLITTVEGILMALIARVTVHLLQRRQHMVFRVLHAE